MLSKNKMLVASKQMKETKDRIPYAAIGLVSMYDGQKCDVRIRS